MKDGLARKSEKLNTTACLSVLSACHNKEKEAHGAKETISRRGPGKAVFTTSPFWLFHTSRCRKDMPKKYVYFFSLLYFVILFHFCLLQLHKSGPMDTLNQVMFIGEYSILQ